MGVISVWLQRVSAPAYSDRFIQRQALRRSRRSGAQKARLTLIQSGEAMAEPLRRYSEDPIGFFREVLRIEPWSKQIEIMEALQRKKEVHVAACHGVGKTLSAAGIAEWWFSARGFPVITTAPTGRQVKRLLWQQGIETNRMRASQKLPGRLLKTQEVVVPGRPDWFMYGFSTDDPENAQGAHWDNLLVIVDEAGGVDDGIWHALDGYLTNPGTRLLAIGNPSKRKNAFYRAHHERIDDPNVACIHISAFDSPNLDGDSQWPRLVDRAWIEDKRRKWVEGSYLWRTRVMGMFPSDQDEKAIPMEWIMEAFKFGEELAAEEAAMSPEERELACRPIKAALDVSRSGEDKNALVYLARQRLRLGLYWKETHQTFLMAVAEKVDRWVASQRYKPGSLHVDINAIGAGCKDRLEQLKTAKTWGECQLVGLDWRATPDNPSEHKGTLSELFFRLREALNPNQEREHRIGLPTREELARFDLTPEMVAKQLNARKGWWDEFRRFCVESKQTLRGRRGEEGIGSSPDVADAMAAVFLRPKVVDIAWFSGT